jgi:tetratricopeptide (TPR) repeat protein
MADSAARSMRQLTGMMHAAGYRDHAERLYRRSEVLEMERAQQNEALQTTPNRKQAGTSRASESAGMIAMLNLAEMYAARGNYTDAVRLHRRVIQTEEEAVGTESPLLIPRLHALATVLDESGDHHEALCVREKILQLQSMLEEV